MQEKINVVNQRTSNVNSTQKEINFRRLGWLLAVVWTVLLVIVLLWNRSQIKQSTHEEALMSLRMTVEKDLIFRAWATKHGGVYVPVTPDNPPNPYLTQLEERDVLTTTGKELTLLNPAYVMRQVNELGKELFGICGHLTSLQPKNPANAADEWEAVTLKAFEDEHELGEISTVGDYHGEVSLRLMRPFYVEDGCLKCHGDQGYQIGDVRGAISAVTPLAPYLELIKKRQLALLPGYAIFWTAGLGALWWFMRRLAASEQSLKQNLARNRAMVEAIPDMIFRYSRDGVYLDAEIKHDAKVALLIKDKLQEGGMTGQRIADVFPAEIAQTLLQAIDRTIRQREMQVIEYGYITQHERLYFEERLVLEDNNKDEVISIVRDVTEQKKFATKLQYHSYHDSLTGLYNRRFFEEELSRLDVKRNLPLTIIVGDVNGLKLINDAFGHLAGDQLLQRAAQVIKQACRADDIIARWGGDEYVAILPKTQTDDALIIIDRIKELCAQTEVEGVKLSISFGLATKAAEDEDLKDVLIAAETEMYKNKLREGQSIAGRSIRAIHTKLLQDNEIEAQHSRRVAEISKKIAEQLGLDEAAAKEIEYAALLHDIGKIAVGNAILNKASVLTEDERALIRRHSEIGYRILNTANDTVDLANYVLTHHEWYDGTGYPTGITGEEIPLPARIIAVADAFAAMTSWRAYRDAQPYTYAISELRKYAGSQFDPQVVEIFIGQVLEKLSKEQTA